MHAGQNRKLCLCTHGFLPGTLRYNSILYGPPLASLLYIGVWYQYWKGIISCVKPTLVLHLYQIFWPHHNPISRKIHSEGILSMEINMLVQVVYLLERYVVAN